MDLAGNSDVGDLKLVTICQKIMDVGDQNGQKRHLHPIVVTNTFRRHPLQT